MFVACKMLILSRRGIAPESSTIALLQQANKVRHTDAYCLAPLGWVTTVLHQPKLYHLTSIIQLFYILHHWTYIQSLTSRFCHLLSKTTKYRVNTFFLTKQTSHYLISSTPNTQYLFNTIYTTHSKVLNILHFTHSMLDINFHCRHFTSPNIIKLINGKICCYSTFWLLFTESAGARNEWKEQHCPKPSDR